VACCFLSSFYKGFVQDLPALVEMYGDRSTSSCARFGEAVGRISQGKSEIRKHLEQLDAELGPRKVHIRSADFVMNANEGGSVVVAVSGQLFTKCLCQVFSQTFVLAPTKYQDQTWYIATDLLRLISQEPDVVPAGAVVVTPELLSQRMAAAAEAAAAAAAAAAAKDQRPPRRERKERVPREPKTTTQQIAVTEQPTEKTTLVTADAPVRREKKERKSKPNPAIALAPQAAAVAATVAVAAAVPQEQQVALLPKRKQLRTGEKKNVTEVVTTSAESAAPVVVPESSKKPAATAAAADSKPAAGAVKRLTSKVRLIKVPKTIKLSEVRELGKKYGDVKDCMWIGEDSEDAVIVFATPEEARSMVYDSSFALKVRRYFFFY